MFALQNEPGIYRLWLPNVDSPGLAMSRSFGDFCLKDFGLVSVPDLSYHRLNHRDQFVVLATDGVTLNSLFSFLKHIYIIPSTYLLYHVHTFKSL